MGNVLCSWECPILAGSWSWQYFWHVHSDENRIYFFLETDQLLLSSTNVKKKKKGRENEWESVYFIFLLQSLESKWSGQERCLGTVLLPDSTFLGWSPWGWTQGEKKGDSLGILFPFLIPHLNTTPSFPTSHYSPKINPLGSNTHIEKLLHPSKSSPSLFPLLLPVRVDA